MQNAKIALILTGGTIGSTIEENVIGTGEKSVYRLVDAYEKEYGGADCFEIFSPFQMLSENMRPADWEKLSACIEGLDEDKYRAVVIAHGTDTLAYTAAYIGMLFCGKKYPILLIGSNYPIGEEHSNGLRNLRAAVELSGGQIKRGCYVIYENDKGRMEVHLSTRILPADCLRDQYGYFGEDCFGVMENGRFLRNVFLGNPTEEEVEEACEKRRSMQFPAVNLSKEVLLLEGHPGLRFDCIKPTEGVSAVLYKLYHAGTYCAAVEPYSFEAFAKRCIDSGIPVFAVSVKKEITNRYESSLDAERLGVTFLEDISAPAAYAKLCILMNVSKEKRQNFLGENLFFEQIDR